MAGIVLASFFATAIVLFLFLFAPVSHYLGAWSDWWSEPSVTASSDGGSMDEYRASVQKYQEAYTVCDDAATKHFKTTKVAVHASSTSGDYDTYDCYGIPYKKVPLQDN